MPWPLPQATLQSCCHKVAIGFQILLSGPRGTTEEIDSQHLGLGAAMLDRGVIGQTADAHGCNTKPPCLPPIRKGASEECVCVG